MLKKLECFMSICIYGNVFITKSIKIVIKQKFRYDKTMKKIRLDDLLVKRKIYQKLDDAQSHILAKQVKVEDVFITNCGQEIPKNSKIEIIPDKKYVSRGGIKLEGAILDNNINVYGKSCLDIGSSTGGFSDCLLQRGVKKVTCVDVNYGQLAWKIRQNKKVTIFERTNIKNVLPASIGAPFDLIVIDVSFIGLSTLCRKIATLCHHLDGEETELLALVKPQFEAKKNEVKKGGIVDENVRDRTLNEVIDSLSQVGFEVINSTKSHILGAESKNIEFFIYAKYY